MKLRKGNVFTSGCQEFCPWGWGVHSLADTPLGQTHTPRQTPPWVYTPRHTPPRQTPPGIHPLGRHPQADTSWADPLLQTPHPSDGHCSGRYASYWNAFLLSIYPVPEIYYKNYRFVTSVTLRINLTSSRPMSLLLQMTQYPCDPLQYNTCQVAWRKPAFE